MKESKKRGMSIRLKYSIAFGLIMAVVILGIWLASRLLLEGFYYRDRVSTMQSVKSEFVTLWTDQDVSDSEKKSRIESLCDRYHISFLVLASDGTPFYSSYSTFEVMRGHLNYFIYSGAESDFISILDKDENSILWRVHDRTLDRDYIECVGFLSDEQTQDSYYPFIMSYPIEAIQESMRFVNRFILGVGGAAIVLSIICGYLLSRRITKPILELTEQTDRMRNLEFGVRYSGKENDEIGRLGNNFNQMSYALEKAISELKTANAELQKENEEKTRIDERRREFLSNVSHELKTPIALISGYAEGLEAVADNPEDREYYCSVIMDEAGKMNRMVRQIMDLSAMESGKEALEIKRFNLTELTMDVIQTMEVTLNEKNAEVEVISEEEYWAWGDVFKIEEVLRNYLTNACNHLEKPDQIRIILDQIPSESGETDPLVRLKVENTGKQIPEEDLPKIWEKFYKVDKARTRAYGGSGIGLSIVKAIMENHGQQYGAENTENGVAFWFTLEKAN